MTEKVLNKKKLLIIGAGPAGLMAAIAAAESDIGVEILEQNDKPGRKLLATGNGRCNYTNRYLVPELYHGDRPAFQDTALRAFSNEDAIRFFHDLGILPDERDGFVYPGSHQASSVLNALLRECRKRSVRIRTGTCIREIQKSEDGFQVITDSGWQYHCDSVILACGSDASQIPGSTGTGYEIAARLGHNLVKPAPALVPLKCLETFRWDGVRTYGTVSLYVDEEYVCVEAGEMQLTDYGISGIPVFQVSRTAVRAIRDGHTVTAVLDFLPDLSDEQLKEYEQRMKDAYPEIKDAELLSGLIPEKLSQALLEKGVPVSSVKEVNVTITGSLPKSRAQVCQGGVDTAAINPDSMGSLIVEGLFFAGEIMDVDGPCGGYNLQWAWSSARLAGRKAAEYLCDTDTKDHPEAGEIK